MGTVVTFSQVVGRFRTARGRRWASRLALPVAFLSTSAADAGFVVYQPPFDGMGVLSQAFPDQPRLDMSCIDDVVITERVALRSLRVFGQEERDPALNVDVIVRILGVPDLASDPLEVRHGVQVGNDLVFGLEGISLDPGTYWLAAQVVRPSFGGWFWRVASTASGAEAMLHRYGQGLPPIPISTLFPGSDPVHDLAFRLEGVPAPGATTIFAMVLRARRRR
jgi:hypothetical protein